jgi:hypothetical protein
MHGTFVKIMSNNRRVFMRHAGQMQLVLHVLLISSILNQLVQSRLAQCEISDYRFAMPLHLVSFFFHKREVLGLKYKQMC